MRQVTELSADRLDALPDRCRMCLFWELGGPRPIDIEQPDARPAGRPPSPAVDELAADPLVQKSAWIRAVEFGGDGHPAMCPGKIIRVDGEPAAWSLFGPGATFAPRRVPVPRLSDEVLFLATVWVERAFRGLGLGRLLIQAAAREAIRHDLRAIEVYGDRRHREAACVAPVTWLLHEGFAVHREHPRYPLLRLDVRSIARWADSLEHAVEQVLAHLGRRPVPAPESPRHASRPRPRSTGQDA